MAINSTVRRNWSEVGDIRLLNIFAIAFLIGLCILATR
ncbi:hypothetical protein APA_2745 [Pseudanabaena sp. lw0831]|nr:hypothetical protein APA_2745 [Pseudanabaena sp. lw0831]